MLALVLIVAGLGLAGYSIFGESPPVRQAVSAAKGDETPAAQVGDPTLKLTVPKMARVVDLPVYDSPEGDETALDKSAMHLQGTGFPWESGSNVYIAGHRMGFPGTQSFLVFYDLDKLEEGDDVYLTDANGTKYSYKVFRKFVASPDAYQVTQPVPGKSVVSLQTCTLPDYTQRLIVQAEMTQAA
jgi:sortase A